MFLRKADDGVDDDGDNYDKDGITLLTERFIPCYLNTFK